MLDSEQPYVSVTDHATRALENVNKEEESLYRPYFDALPRISTRYFSASIRWLAQQW